MPHMTPPPFLFHVQCLYRTLSDVTRLAVGLRQPDRGCTRKGPLKGFILRSQLLVLLAEQVRRRRCMLRQSARGQVTLVARSCLWLGLWRWILVSGTPQAVWASAGACSYCCCLELATLTTLKAFLLSEAWRTRLSTLMPCPMCTWLRRISQP